MSHPTHLGIDIGGTASRWVLCDRDGHELARGKAAGATGHVFNPAENDKLRAVLSAIAAAATQNGSTITSVTAGLTGYGDAVSREVKALISATCGATDIIVVDDIALAYIANFAPGEGHLVSAGTGSIGLHIGTDGATTRVGGRGILIDDAGSGSWIALQALDHIYRILDHNGSFDSSRALASHLFEQVGGKEWSDIRAFVYAGDRGRIGTLAVAVARAAEDGDEAALNILASAGRELALLATALLRRAGHRPLGFIGGVLTLHPAIVDEIRHAHSKADIRILTGDAALAAAKLQALDANGWSSLLTRSEAL